MAKKKVYVAPVLSPEEQAKRNRENQIDSLNRAIRMAQSDVDTFAQRLAKQPASAFEWSQQAFQAAADLELLHAIKERVDDNVTPEALAAWGKDAADSHIRNCFSGRSSSPAVNEINRCRATSFLKLDWLYAPEGGQS